MTVLAAVRSRRSLLLTLLIAVWAVPLLAGPAAASIAPLASDVRRSEPLTLIMAGGVLAATATAVRSLSSRRA